MARKFLVAEQEKKKQTKTLEHGGTQALKLSRG
jgi:hypothetical protein